ncbi:Tectonic domain-containing protein [Plasmodiophora brassicae]|nr:hypothetical protein PBRA_005494 [Plasmodiophora brassicae]
MAASWALPLLLCALVAGSLAGNTTYPIDSSAIVTPHALVPNEQTDIGTCTCDLTYSVCDFGCSCDPDCTTAEQALFSSVTPSGAVQASVPMCVDSNLVAVNKRASLSYTFVDNLICVQSVNNPSLGTFYTSPPSAVTSSQFDALESATPYLFSKASPTATPVPATSNYLVGSPIVAGRSVSGGLVSQGYGFLSIPGPSATFECDDAQFALFGQATQTRCQRTLTSLASSCTTYLNPATYTTALQIGQVAAASPDSVSQYIPITVTETTFVDPNTGAPTTLPSMPVPTYTPGSCQCQNAVAGIAYTFTYNQAGQITQASAAVTVSTVTPSSTCSSGDASGAIVQQYSTSFTRSWTSATGRAKSGNPGYIVGKPVLAGQLQTISASQQAISQQISGLTLVGRSANGQCSLADADRIVVGFGESLHSTCAITLTSAQLAARCASRGVLDYLATLAPLYVGRWGSSTYTNVDDWIQVDLGAPATSYTWSASQLSCTGIVSAMHVEFLTADVGSVLNPQTKIVSARVVYGTDTWRMRTVTGAAGEAQTFQVTVSASFLAYPASGNATLVPPAPPTLPALPHDVLYPLVM